MKVSAIGRILTRPLIPGVSITSAMTGYAGSLSAQTALSETKGEPSILATSKEGGCICEGINKATRSPK